VSDGQQQTLNGGGGGGGGASYVFKVGMHIFIRPHVYMTTLA